MKGGRSFLLPALIFGGAFVYSDVLLDSAVIPRMIFYSLVTFVFAIYFFRIEDKNEMYGVDPITVFFFVWLIFTFISGINAINKIEWYVGFQKVFLYFSVFFVMKEYFHSFENCNESVFKVVVCSTTVLLLVGFSQFIIHDASLSNDGMKVVKGMMNNRNLFSEYLAISLSLNFGAAYFLKNKWKWFATVISLLNIIAVVVLFTRSTYVALISSALLVGLFLLIAALNNKGKIFSKKIVIVSVLAIVAGAGLVVALNVFSNGSIFKRAKTISAINSGSAGGRLKIWSKTKQIGDSAPLIGVGAENWKIVYESYPLSQEGTVFTTEPLNEYLGVYAETGIFGLLGFLGVLISGMVICAIRIIKKQEVFYVFLFSSIMMFAVIAFFSFPKSRIETAVLLSFILALLAGNSNIYLKELNGIFRKSILIAIIFLCAFNIYSWSIRYNSESHLAKAILAKNNGNYGVMLRESEKAQSSFYSLDPTTTPVDWYVGAARFSLGDQRKALSDFESAYQQNPNHLHVINNYATALAVTGNVNDALPLFDKALGINSLFYDAVFNKAFVLYQEKRYQEAYDFINIWKYRRDPKVREFIIELKRVMALGIIK